MFLGERGLYFQAQKDQGGDADQPVTAEQPPLTLKDIEVITTEIREKKGDGVAAAEARGLMD